MKLFIVGTIVFSLCLLLFLQVQYHTMSFSLLHETGDATALQGVELRTGFIDMYGKLFDIMIKDGRLDYRIHRAALISEDEILIDIDMETEKKTSPERWKEAYESGGTSCSSDGECVQSTCTTNVYQQDEGKLILKGFYTMSSSYDDQESLETDLKLYADESLQLLYNHNTCEPTKNIDRDFVAIEPALSYQLLKDHNVSYLMLNIDPHMEGTANIYQIEIQENEHGFKDTRANSIYEIPVIYGTTGFLSRFEDQYYVMLWKDTILKIIALDSSLNPIDMIETSIPIDSMEAMSEYQNDQYLLIKQGKQIACFDFTKQKIIDTLTFEEDMDIADMMYQNGRFYVSAKQRSIETVKETEYANQSDAHILVYEHQDMIYHGRVHLFDRRCEKNEEGICTDASIYGNDTLLFVRDAP